MNYSQSHRHRRDSIASHRSRRYSVAGVLRRPNRDSIATVVHQPSRDSVPSVVVHLVGPVVEKSVNHYHCAECRSLSGVPDFLKFNIGGTSYRLSWSNIEKRGEIGLMYKFFTSCHERRIQLCDGYYTETAEYYFERTPIIFDPIHVYYTTGVCCQPARTYMNVFFRELSFWGLTKTFFPKLDNQTETSVDEELSSKLKFGKIRQNIWNLFEVPESSIWAKRMAVLSVITVLLSNVGLVLGSMHQFQITESDHMLTNFNDTNLIELEKPHPFLEYLEVFCVAFFSIEYVAKMSVAYDRKKVFFQPMNLVDLLTILPFYFEVFLANIGLDTTDIAGFKGVGPIIKILRITHVIRFFKLGKHSPGLQLVGKVMKRSMFQLGMVAMAAIVTLVFFSALVYYAEKDEPETKFESIPASMWWAIVTMTTVGYGDMYPHTIIGKCIASIAIAVGVLVCALPLTIMVDNFVYVQQENNEFTQTISRNRRFKSEKMANYGTVDNM